MKIGIVIVTKNCLDFTKNCIDSLQTKHPYELIIVDDGSTDGTQAWVKAIGATLITGETEASLGGKWNLGAKHAFNSGAEAVLICNNDIIFSPFTIDAVVDRLDLALIGNENIGIVTAHNLRGRYSSNKIKTLKEITWDITESDGPDFSCFLLSKQAFELVGPFSTEYVPCYFEDNDYHISTAQKKLRAISTTGAPYYHFGSVTQNSEVGGVCKGPQFEHNRRLFEQKFGFSTNSSQYREVIDAARTT